MSKKPVYRFATPAVTLALFLFSLSVLRDVSDHAPSLNNDLVVTTVTGQERLVDATSMYDVGSYYFQVGYGYLYSDMLLFTNEDDPASPVDSQTFEQRMALSKETLERSLNLDPANAHAWQAYAQVLTLSDFLDEALVALKNSWDLAPHDRRLAYLRLTTLDFIRKDKDRPDLLAEMHVADARILDTYAPQLKKALSLQR